MWMLWLACTGPELLLTTAGRGEVAGLRRSQIRQRGWLVAAVAGVFLLSAGVVGYLMATRPGHSPAVSSGSSPGSSAGPSSGAAAPPEGATSAVDPQLAAVVRRLRGTGYQVTQGTTEDDTDCAANAYGQTGAYLAEHRCVGLHRALLEVRSPRGATALVAIAWIGMPDQAGATALKAELDRPGSGNIAALSKNDAHYRSVVFRGLYYASARQDKAVVTAEAQSMNPGLTGAQLRSIAAASVR